MGLCHGPWSQWIVCFQCHDLLKTIENLKSCQETLMEASGGLISFTLEKRCRFKLHLFTTAFTLEELFLLEYAASGNRRISHNR